MKILKKITDKRILYIFTLCILIFLPILKQGSFYLVKYNIISNHDSINPAIVLYISIPFLIYVYIKNLIKTKRKLDIYDYLFYILIIAGIIATLLSINKEISLFGKAYRHEGLFTVICYYLLFITWKVEGNKKDIDNLVKVIIGMALLNSIYALFQIYTPCTFVLRFAIHKEMASGISGNPNFFGTLIVTALSIITARFLVDKKVTIKEILLVILLFISLINSQSLGPFLTYIITIIFLIIYLIIKKKIMLKKLIYLILTLVITYISIYYINKIYYNNVNNEMYNFKDKFKDTENIVQVIDKVDSGRLTIWQRSMEIIQKNLIDGVGFDNLYLAYYEGENLTQVYFVTTENGIEARPLYTKIVDNAHNVYMQTLVSTGLLGLIPYLLLCLLTFIKGLRTKNNLVIFLLGGFVAYSIQAFININVIQVTPIYYVIIGLMLSIKQ